MEYRLGLRMKNLHHAIGKRLDRAVSQVDKKLSMIQASILHFISFHQEENVFQKDVEIEFEMKGSTISVMLKQLEENGFLKREKTSEDSRCKKLVVTQKFKEIESLIEEKIRLTEEEIKNRLTEEKIKQFVSLLDELTQNLKEGE